MEPEASGFSADIQNGCVSGNELRLLVSVSSNVEPAFPSMLPPFRGLVVVTKSDDHPHDIECPVRQRIQLARDRSYG